MGPYPSSRPGSSAISRKVVRGIVRAKAILAPTPAGAGTPWQTEHIARLPQRAHRSAVPAALSSSVGSPVVGSPVVGSPVVGSPVVGSPVVGGLFAELGLPASAP